MKTVETMDVINMQGEMRPLPRCSLCGSAIHPFSSRAPKDVVYGHGAVGEEDPEYPAHPRCADAKRRVEEEAARNYPARRSA